MVKTELVVTASGYRNEKFRLNYNEHENQLDLFGLD